MDTSIENIYKEALEALKKASDAESIKTLSVQYLGRKGIVTGFLRNISKQPAEKRAAIGKKTNEIKSALEKAFKDAVAEYEASKAGLSAGIDVTLPGRPVANGGLHPVTQINLEICEIFTRLGFDIVEGPEVESDWYNFEALNIPAHPESVFGKSR